MYSVVKTLPLPSLPYGAAGGKTYVILQRTSEAVTPETLQCQLLFNVVDVDPATGEVSTYLGHKSVSVCVCVCLCLYDAAVGLRLLRVRVPPDLSPSLLPFLY